MNSEFYQPTFEFPVMLREWILKHDFKLDPINHRYFWENYITCYRQPLVFLGRRKNRLREQINFAIHLSHALLCAHTYREEASERRIRKKKKLPRAFFTYRFLVQRLYFFFRCWRGCVQLIGCSVYERPAISQRRLNFCFSYLYTDINT